VRGAGLGLPAGDGEGLRRQLLWDIAQKALGGGPVALGGTGDETRDFIHVSDVAAAVLLTVAGGGRGEERLNVACGQETPIRRVASELLEALGLDPAAASFSGESRPGDPTRWCAEVTRLRALGFRPAVALDQGLRRYADWVRRQAGQAP
jgi:UDP-glucose 4-epimerase